MYIMSISKSYGKMLEDVKSNHSKSVESPDPALRQFGSIVTGGIDHLPFRIGLGSKGLKREGPKLGFENVRTPNLMPIEIDGLPIKKM